MLKIDTSSSLQYVECAVVVRDKLPTSAELCKVKIKIPAAIIGPPVDSDAFATFFAANLTEIEEEIGKHTLTEASRRCILCPRPGYLSVHNVSAPIYTLHHWLDSQKPYFIDMILPVCLSCWAANLKLDRAPIKEVAARYALKWELQKWKGAGFNMCDWCGRWGLLKRCAWCGVVHYCSLDCLSFDEYYHREVCSRPYRNTNTQQTITSATSTPCTGTPMTNTLGTDTPLTEY